MGPEATVLFMSRVLEMTKAEDDSDHIPLLIDNNTQVPSRIKALIDKTGEDPGPTLAAMAKGLEAAGAAALAMPCNTAHHYAHTIENAIDIPFLNMIELSVDRVASHRLSNRRVGLLASPASKLTGVFDRPFERADISVGYARDQDRLLTAIKTIKVDSTDRTAGQILLDASQELMDQGADLILISCSEFSIIADAIPASFTKLDTIDVLAEAAIAFSGGSLAGAKSDPVSWPISA